MKNIKAILFALAITGVIAASMFLVGTNALANKNTVPMANSPQSAVAVSSSGASTSSQQQQITQLETLVQQYQDREKQYQAQLTAAAQKVNDANSQLSQASQQLQQYQQLLIALQRSGVIQITNSGQILIPSNSGFGGGINDDDSSRSIFQ